MTLDKLEALGFSCRQEDGYLYISPGNAVTEELRQQIKVAKSALLAELEFRRVCQIMDSAILSGWNPFDTEDIGPFEFVTLGDRTWGFQVGYWDRLIQPLLKGD